jgi:hypothetical protein
MYYATRSKAWTVFVRLKAGIVGSNPTQDMDVWCVCVCVVQRLGSGLATGWSLVQGVLPSVKNDYGIEEEASGPEWTGRTTEKKNTT